MTKRQLNNIGYFTAAVTFLIATLILIAFYKINSSYLALCGLLFVPVGFLINVTVIITMLVLAKKNEIKVPLTSILTMLLNIPYAIFCIWFANFLLGTYRLTIINDTKAEINKIELSGCESKSIKNLEPGETETVWIKISGDCMMYMNYINKDGIKKEVIIADYLSAGMGKSEEYQLSGKKMNE